MAAKQKPARACLARETGPENVAPVQKIDAAENTSPDTQAQPLPGALLAVRKMVMLGAAFKILRREGRAPSFVYTLPPGASDSDRERCRRIVADVKATGVLSTFVAAIPELQGHQ